MSSRYPRLGLHHLRYFVTTAELASFRRASHALRIAQPALSRAVRQLETDLGVALLHRTRAGVTLTPAGTQLHERAAGLLDAFERIGEGLQSKASATLRVAHVLPEYLRAGPLATALRAFRAANPELELEVQPMLHRKMLAGLAGNRLDLGFAWLPLEDVPDTLRVDVVLTDVPVVALPPRHPQVASGSVKLAALRADPVLLFPRAAMPERFDEIVAMLTRARAGARIVAESASLREVLAAVADAKGFSIVPRQAAEVHRALGFELRPIEGVRAQWSLAMLSPARGGTALCSALAESLRATLR